MLVAGAVPQKFAWTKPQSRRLGPQRRSITKIVRGADTSEFQSPSSEIVQSSGSSGPSVHVVSAQTFDNDYFVTTQSKFQSAKAEVKHLEEENVALEEERFGLDRFNNLDVNMMHYTRLKNNKTLKAVYDALMPTVSTIRRTQMQRRGADLETHFVGGNGPTPEFPDPIVADGSARRPARSRHAGTVTENCTDPKKKKPSLTDAEDSVIDQNEDISKNKSHDGCNIAVQTEETWVSSMDMFAMASELHLLREKEKQYKDTIRQLEEEVKRLKENQAFEDQKPPFVVYEIKEEWAS